MNHDRYPPRVTRVDDGVYRWRAKFSDGQKRKVVKITMGVCGGCCLLLLGMSFFLDGFGFMFRVTLLSCLGAMAIAGLISWLYYRSGGPVSQPYELTEEYVRYIGTSKTDTYFYFRLIRRVRICAEQDLLDLSTLLTTAPVFVPHEDFRFVEDYILNHLPESAEVRFY